MFRRWYMEIWEMVLQPVCVLQEIHLREKINYMEVRGFDSWAIDEMGLAGVVLMENAGRGCAEVILERLGKGERHKVCIFCGTGNNGGDGYVIGRHLANNGVGVHLVICGDAGKVKGDALVNLKIVELMEMPIERLDLSAGELLQRVGALTADCDMIVDAIFGTGLSGELREEYDGLISCINAQKKRIVAVDIPSGLDCDTGLPMPVCIEAEATVTFAAVKKGFVDCADSGQATGDVYVASIGIEPREMKKA